MLYPYVARIAQRQRADILIREVLAIPYKPGFRAYQQRATYWCPEQGRGPTSPVISEELLWSKAIA